MKGFGATIRYWPEPGGSWSFTSRMPVVCCATRSIAASTCGSSTVPTPREHVVWSEPLPNGQLTATGPAEVGAGAGAGVDDDDGEPPCPQASASRARETLAPQRREGVVMTNAPQRTCGPYATRLSQGGARRRHGSLRRPRPVNRALGTSHAYTRAGVRV